MSSIAPREAARRMTHAGFGLFSLTLRWLPWPAVVGVCAGAIAMNVLVLRRAAPGLFRAGESTFSGIRAYPMAVGLLVVLFPLRIAAGAWAILALGDAMAALVGRTWGSAKLPWNRDKSWIGMLAFAAFGTAAGAIAYGFVESRPDPTFGLFGEVYAFFGSKPWLDGIDTMLWHSPFFWWVPPSDGMRPIVWIAAGIAACAAAIAESIKVRLDDNFRTALTAGAFFLVLDPLAAEIFKLR